MTAAAPRAILNWEKKGAKAVEWTRILDIRPGVTAVIGGGGKTTLLRTLGEELAAEGGRVLLCTTTKILPFAGLPCVTEPDALDAAAEKSRLLCAGTLLENGKLAAPAIPMAALAARFDYVLTEADGAAHRPMKAHAPHEPVIPAAANQTICVVGASGLGQPVRIAAHRPERFAALAGVSEEAAITPEMAAAVLLAEGLHTRVLVNQAETAPEWAKALVKLLGCPAAAGSLMQGMLL